MNVHTAVLWVFVLNIPLIQCSNVNRDDIEPSRTVNTTLGLIRGAIAEDGDYYTFMGIPYAQVNPLNPFGKAIPQEPFDDVFDAIDDSAICPQIEEFNHTIVGCHDCLHINIYAPISATPETPKAVMVMIYGGSFTIGFAGRYLYGPKYLVRHDVLLVTFNYRLGVYGFMCLDTPEIPGNEGFKDQLMAFRWIKENIAAFGGNPNQITAFGNSAGGMSVDFHLLTHHEPLFNQGILQSGTSLSATHSQPNKNAPFTLANHFGYVTDNIDEAISFLAAIDTDLMIAATSDLNLSFPPCIEEQFEGVESFLTEDWIQAEMPKVKEMPILIGNTDSEGLTIFLSPPEIFTNILIPIYLNNAFDIGHPDFEGMIEIVHRFYIGDEDVSVANAMHVIEFIEDMWFVHPSYRSINKYLSNGAGDIFFYLLSYVGDRNFVRHKDNIPSYLEGTVHADELGYLFDISYFDTPNAEDQLMVDRMTQLWTNFAKFGNPTPETSDVLPVVWEPIRNSSNFHALEINLEPRQVTRPFHERMSFLDLFYNANAHLLRGNLPRN